jgi:hypothetical protein
MGVTIAHGWVKRCGDVLVPHTSYGEIVRDKTQVASPSNRMWMD